MLPPDEERYAERSWADDGLNSPVGRLTQILLEDEALKRGRGIAVLSVDWKMKMVSLLFGLPGNLRRHALVLVSYQFLFLCAIDRHWAAANILPIIDTEDPESDAFWDGFLWANKVPCPPLFKKMRSAFLKRISQRTRRRPITDALADIMLYAWLSWSDRRRPPLSNKQFREAIVEGGVRASSRTRTFSNFPECMAAPEGVQDLRNLSRTEQLRLRRGCLVPGDRRSDKTTHRADGEL